MQRYLGTRLAYQFTNNRHRIVCCFFPVHGTFCAVTEKRLSLLPTSVNKLKKEAKKVEKKVMRLQQLTIRQDFPYQIFSIFDR